MVFHQDRLLNGAVPPTRFPFVSLLVAAPIGWSSINSVSLLLGARFGAGFLVRVSNHGIPPHVPPAWDQQPRPLGGLSHDAWILVTISGSTR